MFDLNKEKTDVKCPKCNRKHQVTFRQVIDRLKIQCSCGTIIQFEDSKGSVKKGVKEINEAFKKL